MATRKRLLRKWPALVSDSSLAWFELAGEVFYKTVRVAPDAGVTLNTLPFLELP